MNVDEKQVAELVGFPINRQKRILNVVEGLKRVMVHVDTGIRQCDACERSDVVTLTGSDTTAKRYWRTVRNKPVEQWVGLIASRYQKTSVKSDQMKKRLGPVTEAAALRSIAGQKFYSLAQVHRIAKEAGEAAGEDVPSSKWFERYFHKPKGIAYQK